MTTKIPLKPERVVDFTWGLSLFFSNDEQERKFGEYIQEKWEALSKKYEEDPVASAYFDNLNAAMSATVNNLAQVRKEADQGLAFLDSLQGRKMSDLDDLAKLSRDAESIAIRIAGLSIGGGVSFLGLATEVIGAREISFIILGATGAAIVLEIILRAYRIWKAPRIMAKIKKEKEELLNEQFKPKSEEILAEFLKKQRDF